MSNNLLTIERAFLSIPAVKQGLKLSEYKTLQRNVENAQKKKFDHIIDLSKVVLTAFNWFKSAEGQALCSEEGITWSAEEFSNKVFGIQKSYFYKLTRAGKLEEHLITEFKLKCNEVEAEGGVANRSLEALLKYAKEVEQGAPAGGEEGEEVGESKEGENEPQVSARPQVVMSFEYKPEGIKIQVMSDGAVKMSEGTTPEIIKGFLNIMLQSL